MVFGILLAGIIGGTVGGVFKIPRPFRMNLNENDERLQQVLDARKIPLTIWPRVEYPNSKKLTKNDIMKYYQEHWLKHIPDMDMPNVCHTYSESFTNPYISAKKLYDQITFFTLEDFHHALDISIHKLLDLQADFPSINLNNYSVIFLPEKSSQWVASLAISKDEFGLPTHWLPLDIPGDKAGINLNKEFNESLDELDNHMIDTIIYFDDVSYSGTQILAVLDNIVERILIFSEDEPEEELSSQSSYKSDVTERIIDSKNVQFRDYIKNIIIVLPILSNTAFKLLVEKMDHIQAFIGDRMELKIHLIGAGEPFIIKNVRELMSEAEFMYLYKLNLVENMLDKTLTFTEWKVASRHASILKLYVNPELDRRCDDDFDVNPPYKKDPVHANIIEEEF